MSQGEDAADRIPGAIEAVLAGAREKFEDSTDFTVGIEEEYAICDPETLDLVNDYDRVEAAAMENGLETAIAGELLASEVEFRTGRNESWVDGAAEITDVRARVSALMADLGLKVGISGTHPWADYREQEKIDAPYYQRLVQRLGYVAHRNNTFGLHVHVGVNGPDRAMAVADAVLEIQPLLLALSASSPFLDGRDADLKSARSLTFSRTFPRGNIAPTFGTFDNYLDHVRWLAAAGSIETYGQMWWGTRLHALHGTVEFRMFDGQPDVRDTCALAALAVGTVADLVARYDAGELTAKPQPAHLVDENLWRASRWGTDADMIKLPTTDTVPVKEALLAHIEVCRAAAKAAGIDLESGLARATHMVERGCSANVQLATAAAHGTGNGHGPDGLRAAYRDVVETTMSSSTAART